MDWNVYVRTANHDTRGRKVGVLRPTDYYEKVEECFRLAKALSACESSRAAAAVVNEFLCGQDEIDDENGTAS